MFRRRSQWTVLAAIVACGVALACAPDGDEAPGTAGSEAAAGQDAPVSHPSTLVLTNGRIVTLDDDLPEATALAARD
ncbi:MAG: hypothetical protein R3344_08145, partial [Acidobacteriota bacterium]|nr:hypothetical protein [Acidobacteriota bacterium]